jgi:ribonuclease Y
MGIVALLVGLLVGLAAGAAVAWLVSSRIRDTRAQDERDRAHADAERILEGARARERELTLAAKDDALRLREEIERELKEQRGNISRQERRIQQREETLDRKATQLEKRDQELDEREREVDIVRAEAEQLRARQITELERVSNLTRDEARGILLASIEDEVRDAANRRTREIEAEIKEDADRRARSILATAIQRCAPDYVAEGLVTAVPLPSDDMKGRIIGREGRNIRALEQALGVDLIIDDTPETIMVSSFDPVRRETARRVLAKLLQDGRIHPARIEEVTERITQEMDQVIKEEGERVAYEANVAGLHPELIRLMGRLKFRTSYGQNVLQHSLEVSIIAAGIAAEIGADVNVARTAGLLHDIGKAVDHEVEGPHALIGAEIAQRLGRSSRIVHAIAAHHGEVQPETVEAFIVATADSISGGRPGARREMVDLYIKRLEALESIANSFPGVERSFAIQAGREVRIAVKPDVVDDLTATRLARDVVKKIEETMEYPGQIKVTVIREMRVVDYAR